MMLRVLAFLALAFFAAALSGCKQESSPTQAGKLPRTAREFPRALARVGFRLRAGPVSRTARSLTSCPLPASCRAVS